MWLALRASVIISRQARTGISDIRVSQRLTKHVYPCASVGLCHLREIRTGARRYEYVRADRKRTARATGLCSTGDARLEFLRVMAATVGYQPTRLCWLSNAVPGKPSYVLLRKLSRWSPTRSLLLVRTLDGSHLVNAKRVLQFCCLTL